MIRHSPSMYAREIMTATELLSRLRSHGLTLVTAESCTGGLLAGAITEIAGSSDVFAGGVITYSNALKHDLLDVPADMLARHGAVSETVARAMAEGALCRLGADMALSVTGVAGPGGGSPEKPVGLVHFAAALKDWPTLHRECRFGDKGRSEVRCLSVDAALALAAELLGSVPSKVGQ